MIKREEKMKSNIKCITLFVDENPNGESLEALALFDDKLKKKLERRKIRFKCEVDKEGIFQKIFINYRFPLARVDTGNPLPNYYHGVDKIRGFKDSYFSEYGWN